MLVPKAYPAVPGAYEPVGVCFRFGQVEIASFILRGKALEADNIASFHLFDLAS